MKGLVGQTLVGNVMGKYFIVAEDTHARQRHHQGAAIAKMFVQVKWGEMSSDDFMIKMRLFPSAGDIISNLATNAYASHASFAGVFLDAVQKLNPDFVGIIHTLTEECAVNLVAKLKRHEQAAAAKLVRQDSKFAGLGRELEALKAAQKATASDDEAKSMAIQKSMDELKLKIEKIESFRAEEIEEKEMMAELIRDGASTVAGLAARVAGMGGSLQSLQSMFAMYQSEQVEKEALSKEKIEELFAMVEHDRVEEAQKVQQQISAAYAEMGTMRLEADETAKWHKRLAERTDAKLAAQLADSDHRADQKLGEAEERTDAKLAAQERKLGEAEERTNAKLAAQEKKLGEAEERTDAKLAAQEKRNASALARANAGTIETVSNMLKVERSLVVQNTSRIEKRLEKIEKETEKTEKTRKVSHT